MAVRVRLYDNIDANGLAGTQSGEGANRAGPVLRLRQGRRTIRD